MCTGSAPQVVSAPKPTGFPGAEDLTIARKYDQAYGDPSAPFLNEGGAVINKTDYDGAIAMSETGKAPNNRLSIDKGTSDTIGTAWVAAQRSPIMALGFDPRKMTVTDPVKGDPGLTVAGYYLPEQDQLWIDGKHQTTFVHESIHRSMEILKKEGKMPKAPDGLWASEETLTRAFMYKHFGPAEKGKGDVGDAQVDEGADLLKRQAAYLDEVEKAAAKLIAQRKSRGPK